MKDLTQFALSGYDAPQDAQPEFTHGSSAFVAWRVGQWLKRGGGIRPTKVEEQDGYAVLVDGVKVVIPAGATGEPYVVGS
ncbi:MAG: hypothetical protein ABW034_13645 [Steroidobacteraceae bacterium]